MKVIHKTNEEEIVCTKGHRIYINNKGFTLAENILVNDEVILYNNTILKVIKVEVEKLEKEETTYNFEVEDYHTYYVSEECVLVHNDCHPNGIYEDAPYHTKGNSVKGPRPIDGQGALDNSIQIKSTSPRRLGYSENQLVILDQTNTIVLNGKIVPVYHGHVRIYSQLNPKMKYYANKVFNVWR